MPEHLATGIGMNDAVEEPPLAVVISDIHIGERYGCITGNPAVPGDYIRLNDSDGDGPYVRPEFMSFLEYCLGLKQQYGQIKYLVILGDMWDLAMNNQEDSFEQSMDFFQQLNALDEGMGLGDLFQNIIYIPGNHDHHLWEMLQERYWVTGRIEQGLPPLTMPRTLSLSFDITTGDILPENAGSELGIPTYNIVSSLLGLDDDSPVYVAYPNVYFRGLEGGHILLTHGHLFEPDWYMVTIMFGDLMVQQGIPLTIRNIEMFNAITTEWHSYSLGQTPPYEFWETVYDHSFDNLHPSQWEQTFLQILDEHITVNDVRGDPETPSRRYHSIEALESERGLVEYYLAQAQAECLSEGSWITALIYGHTHIPAFNEVFVRHHGEEVHPLWVHNTGGWVDIDAERYHLPAPMLIYGDGSVRALTLKNGVFSMGFAQ
ncbi:MAG: metallophosphoesterase [Candidatus Fermentibacteraceae bacterium]|nr:metallophosphoesterase [Candidatus Fermentibacteraceae bacterium]